MNNRNVNRPGYKETRVGWIPEDWEVKWLADVAEINPEQLPEKAPPDLSFYYLTLADVEQGEFSTTNNRIRFENAPSRARRKFQPGDILLSTVRPNLRGFGYVDFDSSQFVCSTGFAVIHPKSDVYGRFIYFNLYSHNVEKYFDACVVGSNYPALNNNDVEKLKLPFPPLSEQRKIAEILSAWDKAIELVGKQIEAKQRLRKGLMQQLLTGKMRFEGFGKPVGGDELPEGWREVRLKTVCEILVSNVDKKTQENEVPVLLCNYLDVYNNEYITGRLKFMVATATNAEIRKFKLRVGDIVFTKDTETRDDIARTAMVAEDIDDLVCGYHLAILRPKQNGINSLFFAKMIWRGKVNNYLISRANGVTRFGLTISAIENAPIQLPDIEEQTSIANTFMTMDREIEILEHKASILAHQKQGLMQKLLTGEVRVKV